MTARGRAGFTLLEITIVLGLAALPPGRTELVTLNGEDVALFRRGDEIFAIGNQCPHQGGNLCDGFIEGDIVTCPLHGWEFDHAQHPAVMDLLCYNLSDEAGQDRSEMWTRLHGLEGELKDLFDFHGGPEGYISHLLQTPEVRLPQFLTDVERSAYSSVNEGEILVFGHTHRPFVSKDNKLVNAGSWVSDAPVHNTFVELDGGQIRLFVFDSKGATEITERISFAATANPSP